MADVDNICKSMYWDRELYIYIQSIYKCGARKPARARAMTSDLNCEFSI
jgi:hypothetical protein